MSVLTQAVAHKPLLLLGQDLLATQRAERLITGYSKRLSRLLNPAELAYCLAASRLPQQAERLAVRLAAKEATAKALGVGLNGLGYSQGINWLDISVSRRENGSPTLELSGKAAQLAQQLGVQQWRLALSHQAGLAVATVIGV